MNEALRKRIKRLAAVLGKEADRADADAQKLAKELKIGEREDGKEAFNTLLNKIKPYDAVKFTCEACGKEVTQPINPPVERHETAEKEARRLHDARYHAKSNE